MIGEPTDEEITVFDREARKASDRNARTWCRAYGWTRFTASLRGRECLRCEHHVLRGGVCDPL